MQLTEVIVIAIGLAMDAFAVSLAAGAGAHLRAPRPALRLAFHLGLFQALMPIVGWYLGSRALPLIESIDHWVAFFLLAFVGGRMVLSGFKGEPESVSADPSKGVTMISLSVACSIDALAVGISLAALNVAIWTPSLVIGVVTAAISVIGIILGSKFGDRYGNRAEIFGGLVLIAIGIKILSDH
jgi:putative Mn2+ efflux pump MntP